MYDIFLFVNCGICESEKLGIYRIAMERCQNNGCLKISEPLSSVAEIDEFEFVNFKDRPRTLNTDRNKSLDERSLSELSIGLNAENLYRYKDGFDLVHSPRRSQINTPMSQHTEMHPMLNEGWEALRRALVHFRGKPVGTIAALDNSGSELNYDQVKKNFPLLFRAMIYACACCLVILCRSA